MKWINDNPNTEFDFTAFNMTFVNFTNNTKRNNMLNMVRMKDTYELSNYLLVSILVSI